MSKKKMSRREPEHARTRLVGRGTRPVVVAPYSGELGGCAEYPLNVPNCSPVSKRLFWWLPKRGRWLGLANAGPGDG